ncbi:D-serine deaminase, pyridoxal phosphate-dependent [Blastococcus aurantiacus]|uniref:D-serine deaminase, pyridoxal phosphate-dependent n=1 Tax=Blastococcus aurantiacus TaxID=1550231 RepID=A0A1G7LCJ8_9ACTN|nr:alanine racemase [Blastococcus aurantiacus]SDF47024.1 D-serine deaminase, pyridoxal phosphate-dependent [Blastococcus aurantiacus]
MTTSARPDQAGSRLAELSTPALVVDHGPLERNLATMAGVWPGRRLRPHVKAHKTSGLARRQAELGHTGFTCATIREVEVMAAAGLGEDLLLANEVLDMHRLGAVVKSGARVTVAVDSDAVLAAAVAGGVREVLIDVNVGLPRCGCDPADAGRLADAARAAGLEVRGVMGYEGHLMMVADPVERAGKTAGAMAMLQQAHADVGGDILSGGGTGTWRTNAVVTELQAGSYALMDTAYAAQDDVPFEQALTVLATVVSVNSSKGYAVADAGLKAFGMDHGNPTLPGAAVWYCSDEHTIFSMEDGAPLPAVGDRVRLVPAHIDPTCAMHERMWVVDGNDVVVDCWPVDMRGW